MSTVLGMPSIQTLRHDNTFNDTPCARCGHGHAGANQFWSGNTRTYLERCGEWMSEWSLSGASLWPCDCPEWIEPPFRCRCGKTSLKRFPSWLNGARACSAACAAHTEESG